MSAYSSKNTNVLVLEQSCLPTLRSRLLRRRRQSSGSRSTTLSVCGLFLSSGLSCHAQRTVVASRNHQIQSISDCSRIVRLRLRNKKNSVFPMGLSLCMILGVSCRITTRYESCIFLSFNSSSICCFLGCQCQEDRHLSRSLRIRLLLRMPFEPNPEGRYRISSRLTWK
jgi:hypothetical protein